MKTKYEIGDKVYRAGTYSMLKKHPCPDCKGVRTWTAISRVGIEYEIPCPRCTASFQFNSELSLSYNWREPTVSKLTIGSVRTDSADEYPISYMCVETGVGSGSIYYEHELFSTDEEALVAAEALVAVETGEGTVPHNQFKGILEYSDYQFESALIKAAKNSKAEVSANLSLMFDKLWDATTMDEVRAIMEETEL